MKILDDWLLDLIIWHEATDPYEDPYNEEEEYDEGSELTGLQPPVQVSQKKKWYQLLVGK